MPLTYSISDDGLGLYSKGEGVVCGNEIASLQEFVTENSQHIKNLKFLIDDYSDVKSLNLSNSDIKEISLRDGEIAKDYPNIVCCIVATEDLMFGISRQLGVYTNIRTNWETQVVKTIEEAENWVQENLKEK